MRQYLIRAVLGIAWIILIGCPGPVRSQGIKFEQGSSWEQIMNAAREAHKYIFVDCYATWCGPCKLMDQQIYPNDTVGRYMNAHFVSVRVQVDRTDWDSEDTKAWYPIANRIRHVYSVTILPTFLFFSSDGWPLHKAFGAKLTTAAFLDVVKNAQNPE